MDPRSTTAMLCDVVSLVPSFASRIVPLLVEEARSSDQSLVRDSCREALRFIRCRPLRFGLRLFRIPTSTPPAAPTLPPELEEVAQQLRALAGWGQTADDEAQSDSQRATTDEVLALKDLLLAIVREIGEDAARPVLRMVIERCRTEPHPDLREVYLRTLSAFPSYSDEFIEIPLALLRAEDENDDTKWAAASVIAALGAAAENVLEELLVLITCPETPVQTVSTLSMAIGNIGTSDFEVITALQDAAVIHRHPLVRRGLGQACLLLELDESILGDDDWEGSGDDDDDGEDDEESDEEERYGG